MMTPAQFPIYSIGYGKRTIAEFIDLLQRHRIQYLVDVRTTPYSRFNPDFSREPLKKHLAAHQIHYIYLGDSLGGRPADPTCYTDGQVDFQKLSQKDYFQEGIMRLTEVWAQGFPLAVMCSEAKPQHCHRSVLIAPALTARGIEVVHIE